MGTRTGSPDHPGVRPIAGRRSRDRRSLWIDDPPLAGGNRAGRDRAWAHPARPSTATSTARRRADARVVHSVSRFDQHAPRLHVDASEYNDGGARRRRPGTPVGGHSRAASTADDRRLEPQHPLTFSACCSPVRSAWPACTPGAAAAHGANCTSATWIDVLRPPSRFGWAWALQADVVGCP